MLNNEAKAIVDKLNLEKHIEGGYFKRTYQTALQINVEQRTRPIQTAIYYLLESGDYSCWHRLKMDEMWHYYAGSELIIHQLNDKGVLTSTLLGNVLMHEQAVPQYVVLAGNWFCAEVVSPQSFTLVGCTVAPGFDYRDFEMANRQQLLHHYPQHEKIITQFTRD